ncbi:MULTISPECIES: LuxR C-terminal-related transcriptional regulator [unclassified Chelatococcus]|uniref:LuxR C-terminal-related transcriptional regulator n=1 Tax=unclassified Chelatococcus TaxID=2638111 RepID=UPI001BCDA89D|nr:MULTISPECIES: LuxR C-terminal-related transcriptional regulator [unclassified Chelatococcus]MBS7743736.1 hypothetical protein [Chelatococcus sp. HY11]MBX3547262.1 hypothetical protein [Chelatococcus sp.]CAH1664761.1 HTH luxR-type domain-containing protein [Hyphomicrobiales bacterium]CAH1688481.1 HTH luxR-type domain-containing protein [Hyphomicrobiales bacterium]
MPASAINSTPDAPSYIGKHVIDRPRLRGMASDLLTFRLTHIGAPAGFGKTTLMRQWYETLMDCGRTAIWLNASRHEHDIVHSLIQVLSPAMPNLHDVLERGDHVAGFRTTDLEVRALLRATMDWDRPLAVFIDEADLLSKESGHSLLRLIEWLPQNVSFICASRGRLPFPTARLLSLGEVRRIGIEELRFTPQEMLEAAKRTGITNLLPAEVEKLHARTEGWATGVKLALLAMRGQTDRARLLASFSGHKSLVADFFSETVLGQQTEEVQNFLMRTGLLEQFTADMCDAVLGFPGSRELLSQIENGGLFLIPLDDERNLYRYHGLFASFLERRLNDLEPGVAHELHRSASRWLMEAGQYRAAIDHAIKGGDVAWLVEMLDHTCEHLTYRGSMTYLEELANQLPAEIVAKWPRLLMVLAWAQIRRMQIESAERLLDLARARIEEMEVEGTDPSEVAKLHYTLGHREMLLAAALDKFSEVETLVKRLQQHDVDPHPYIACTLFGQKIRALREQFKMTDLEKLEAKARGVLEKSGFKFAYVALQGIVGSSLHAIGRTAAGKQALEHGLSQAVSFSGENTGLGALPALPLAELAYESNDLQTARSLISGYLGKARVYGFADELACGYTVAARLYVVDEDFEAAFRILDEASSIALECGIERLRMRVIAERVHLYLRLGYIDRVWQLTQSNIPSEPDSLLPSSASTSIDEAAATIFVRYAMTAGEQKNAWHVVNRWRQFTIHRGAVRSQLHWNLLAAQCHYLMGDRRAAQRNLREAVIYGAENRLLRSFIDEGAIIRELLEEAYGDSHGAKHPAEHFARELLQEFGGGRSGPAALEPEFSDELGFSGKITGREIEILNFVAAGLRNREIGSRLGLTEGSVKWYMQQIYDKIGTRRRTVAVERARQFGLLGQ